MGNVRSLANGRTKLTILTIKPADPTSPTAAELNAGIDVSCAVMDSDFLWRAADSERVTEKAVCVEGNAQVPSTMNFEGGVSIFREFDETTKNAHATADAAFQAMKVQGTRLWGYARETAKKSREDWEAEDEIYLGGEVLTDVPQKPTEMTGYIKRRVPLLFQDGYPDIEVAPAAP